MLLGFFCWDNLGTAGTGQAISPKKPPEDENGDFLISFVFCYADPNSVHPNSVHPNSVHAHSVHPNSACTQTACTQTALAFNL